MRVAFTAGPYRRSWGKAPVPFVVTEPMGPAPISSLPSAPMEAVHSHFAGAGNKIPFVAAKTTKWEIEGAGTRTRTFDGGRT